MHLNALLFKRSILFPFHNLEHIAVLEDLHLLVFGRLQAGILGDYPHRGCAVLRFDAGKTAAETSPKLLYTACVSPVLQQSRFEYGYVPDILRFKVLLSFSLDPQVHET